MTRAACLFAALGMALGLAGLNQAALAQEDPDLDAACQELGAEGGYTITLGNGETASLCDWGEARACTLEAQLTDACGPGGRKTTGYATQAARYCAWLGGEVTTAKTIDPILDEIEGTCALPDGRECTIGRLYYGTCDQAA